ncbi:phage tail length tape measure family protein [Brucella anthropi]|uniref:phage tail length tape measure family protein n=1 Tax=Brucella anthropi TaxID=529 RepID=UPI0005B98BC0|nr:phage tail length tape measure family protein [Brucella anthropi]KIU69117.1 hypothetical protein TR92_07525 [Brucella anthropi]
MAGNTAYKLGIVISTDASGVKPGAAEARNELATIGTAAEVTETKMQRLIATATGLHAGAANGNQRAWIGALADEGMALDQLRQKYNPMFAVIREYKAAQTEIRTAHAMGALSADEMTAALDRQRKMALASMDAIKGRNNAANNNHFAAQNAMFQMQDVGMTAAMGMDWRMIGLQQGTQLAGGMAGMNMKQAGASLVSAFTMLLSPVSLATVAVTGLTAAAIQYAMKWTGNAKSLSQTIEEHEAQIKRLHDAYQYAGTGAENYYQRINAGQRFLTFGTQRELQRTVKDETDDILNTVGYRDAYSFSSNDPWKGIYDQFKPFEDAIQHLRDSAKKGQPDLLEFRRMVEDRWSLDENNKALADTAKKLLDLGPNAVSAALALEKFSAAEIRARNAAEAARRRGQDYASAIGGLRDIAAPQLSDRRKVDNEFATARGNAGDRDERADALRQRDDALARINAQEQRQIQLAQIDIQLQTARDPLTRAQLTAERERIQLQGMDIAASEARNRIQQARNQVIAEALAQSSAQIIDMRAEVEARRNVTNAIIAGTISAADAQTYLEAESQLRPLIAAAARAEGVEKQALLETINAQTAAYKGLAEERRRADAVEYLQNQKDHADQLRLELSLVGATEVARRRALASFAEEQKLKRDGIAVESELGKARLQNAAAIDEGIAALERSKDAWDSWRSAGENAISSVVDNLAKGDIKGALAGIAQASADFFKEDIKKSLSNMVLGTDYGTIEDMFSGGSSAGLLSGVLGGKSVGAMNVQAAVVNVGGVGLGGADGLMSNVSRMFGAANSNIPGGAGISQFAAAIRSIESAGSGGYSALGPITANGDRAYGAYQVMGANIPSWTKGALGFSMSPDQFLKSSSAQDAVFSKVFGGYVDRFGPSGAAQAWFGGPGSVGKGGVVDMLGTSGTDYVNKFNSALNQVTATAGTTGSSLTGFAGDIGAAGKGLGELGSGFSGFGKQLSSFAAGGGGLGGLGGIFSMFPGLGGFKSQQLAGAIASGSWGLWDTGGYTGPGGVHEPRGIVHAGEVVWSQRDVARAGGPHVVDAMRRGLGGYAYGGIVDTPSVSPYARFNNPGGSTVAQARPTFGAVTVHQDLRGVNNENARQEAYEGMMQALEDFSTYELPDRVHQISERPRWRG